MQNYKQWKSKSLVILAGRIAFRFRERFAKRALKDKKGSSSKISRARLRGREKLGFYLIGGVLVLTLGWIFLDSLLSLFLLPLLLFLEPYVAEEWEKSKLQKKEDLFRQYLTELDSFIRLGYSLESSTLAAAQKSPLFQDEWISQELEMNVYIIEIFQKMADAKELESLKIFAGVLQATLESGGNLHELMQNHIIQIQKKIKMEQEIHSVLTKIKYESRILVLFVPFLILFLKHFSTHFETIMYHSLPGRMMMLVCLGFYFLASYLCYSMSQVEV